MCWLEKANVAGTALQHLKKVVFKENKEDCGNTLGDEAQTRVTRQWRWSSPTG